MKRMYLLFKISLQYWKHHKKRFLALMIALVIGVAALSCAALLICSEKEAVLERELCFLGDYDVIVVDLTSAQLEQITNLEHIDQYGTYLDLGYAGVRDDFIKAAAFPDQKSEKMYHMTCLRGEYPKNENEIALDLMTLKSLGIKPYPGETISLAMYSLEHEKLGEKEFIVSGIFEASEKGVYGGWYRYPGMKNPQEYDMPGVFFYGTMDNLFHSNTVTMFIQTDTEADMVVNEIMNTLGEEHFDWDQIDVPSGRRFAYSYVLGVINTLLSEYDGQLLLSGIIDILKNGTGIKDFYSGVVMPIFTILVSFIVVLSVFGITRNVIQDKNEQLAILRSIGMESYKIVEYLFCDFTVKLPLSGSQKSADFPYQTL